MTIIECMDKIKEFIDHFETEIKIKDYGNSAYDIEQAKKNIECFKTILNILENEEKESHIENLKKLKSFHNGSYGASINEAIKALEHQKTGEWIPVYPVDDERDNQKCSVCGQVYDGATRFCPDCGSRMF